MERNKLLCYSICRFFRIWLYIEKNNVDFGRVVVLDIKYDKAIPEDVVYIINHLEDEGYEAYMVGGCVRDMLLKKVPNDWDITTNATPSITKEIFEKLGLKVVPTGIKHGTITVIINNNFYEITTYRIDGEYKDGRHPLKVSFTDKLKEDLRRRDFTINAMAYNPKEGFIDYFNGVNDLDNRIIRTVGNPYDRFLEDGLRIMRAIRFSAQLDFPISAPTREAIKNLSNKLDDISIERIREEFNKIILSNPLYINDLIELNILNHIVPENIIMEHRRDIKKGINCAKNIDKILYLRLTMIFYDIEQYYDILKRLKYDNRTIERVRVLIDNKYSLNHSKKQIKKVLSNIGEEAFKDLLKVHKVLSYYYPDRHKENSLENLRLIEKTFEEVIRKKECFTIKELDIDGKQIMDMGVQGKRIGEILEILLDKVIDNNNINNNLALKEIVKNII